MICFSYTIQKKMFVRYIPRCAERKHSNKKQWQYHAIFSKTLKIEKTLFGW